jgi:hypothetical protein
VHEPFPPPLTIFAFVSLSRRRQSLLSRGLQHILHEPLYGARVLSFLLDLQRNLTSGQCQSDLLALDGRRASLGAVWHWWRCVGGASG